MRRTKSDKYQSINTFDWLNKSGWNCARLITGLGIYWSSTSPTHYHDLRTIQPCSWVFWLKHQKSSHLLHPHPRKELLCVFFSGGFFMILSSSIRLWGEMANFGQTPSKQISAHTQLTQCFQKCFQGLCWTYFEITLRVISKCCCTGLFFQCMFETCRSSFCLFFCFAFFKTISSSEFLLSFFPQSDLRQWHPAPYSVSFHNRFLKFEFNAGNILS